MKWESSSPVSFQYFHSVGFKSRINTSVYWLCFKGSTMDRYIPDHKTPQKIRNQQFTKPHKFQPVVKCESCTLMLLSNLAYPEWVQVECNVQVFHNTYCVRKRNLEEKSRGITVPVHCPSTCLLQTGFCFCFNWFGKETNFTKHKLKKHTAFHYITFYFLYKAVQQILPPLLYNFSSTSGLFTRFQYRRYLNIYKPKIDAINITQARGFFVWIDERLKQKTGGNMKFCADKKMFVSAMLQCEMAIPGMVTGFHISAFGTLNKPHAFPHFHANSEKLQLSLANVKSRVMYLTCEDKSVLDIILKDDLVADCGSTAEDELHLQALLTYNKATNCEHPFQIPCRTGHSKCFNITEVCSYSLDKYHHLHPCRTGDHLESCINFECTLTFKCTISYCIQWSSICDGKWDCPDGDDERGQPCTDADRCRNMFKCQGPGQTCIPLGNVCDNTKHCPFSDDEHLCILSGVNCPGNCECQIFSLVCNNVSLVQSFAVYPYTSVHFSHVQTSLRIFSSLDFFFPSVVFATLQHCSLDAAYKSLFPKSIMLIDLSFNKIKFLYPQCFKPSSKMKYLALESNVIQSVNSSTFASLSNLTYLSLSHNPLSKFLAQSFPNLTQLSVLNLRNIFVNKIDSNALLNLPNLQIVLPSDFHICCATPSKTKCTEVVPWYLSCFDHLRNNKLKLCFTLISFIIIFVGVLSFAMHISFTRKQIVFLVIVISINVNDVVFSSYFFAMWIADFTHDHRFVLHDVAWTSSAICFTAFSVSLVAILTSPVLLTLMSLTRLMVVIYPLDSAFLRYRFVTEVIVVSEMFCSVLAFCFTLLVKLLENMFPFSLCSPFVDPTHTIFLMKVILWYCVFTQFLSSIAVIINHILLVVNYKTSQMKLQKENSNKKTLSVAPLFIISMSNFLCGVSANSIFITVSFLPQYPIDLVFWTVGAVLPLNSLLIPSILLTGCIRKILK